MTRCVILQPIHEAGQEVLRAAGIDFALAPATDPQTLAPLLAEAEAVITRNFGFPGWAFDLAPRLRLVAVHGTGTDRIDRARAEASGVAIRNTSGTNARSVAEHALGLMIAVARGIPAADHAARSGDFAYRERVRGIELGGRRLGLLGFGSIARHLAPMAQGLGMQVRALSAHADPAQMQALGVTPAADLAELLSTSDVLSLHGLPGTRARLGTADLSLLPPGAILVNTARGALIDEGALAQALRGGGLRGAALDVFDDEPLPAGHPLCDLPNLILTPHIGGSTEDALERTGRAVAGVVAETLT